MKWSAIVVRPHDTVSQLILGYGRDAGEETRTHGKQSARFDERCALIGARVWLNLFGFRRQWCAALFKKCRYACRPAFWVTDALSKELCFECQSRRLTLLSAGEHCCDDEISRLLSTAVTDLIQGSGNTFMCND